MCITREPNITPCGQTAEGWGLGTLGLRVPSDEVRTRALQNRMPRPNERVNRVCFRLAFPGRGVWCDGLSVSAAAAGTGTITKSRKLCLTSAPDSGWRGSAGFGRQGVAASVRSDVRALNSRGPAGFPAAPFSRPPTIPRSRPIRTRRARDHGGLRCKF